MAYILYNLTHIIPKSCSKNNFGIFLSEDRRVLNPGRHRIFEKLSNQTLRLTEKRITHNDIKYEILRAVEVKNDAVMSPEDKKNLEKILDKNKAEIDKKFQDKLNQEKLALAKREEILIQNRLEDKKTAMKINSETEALDLFKKSEGYSEFTNNDGVPSGRLDHLNNAPVVDSPEKEVEKKEEAPIIKKEPKTEKEVMDTVAADAVENDIPEGFTFDDEAPKEEVKEEKKKEPQVKKKSKKVKKKAAKNGAKKG